MAAKLEQGMKNMKLISKKDLNILLLGETGVGKSTFINSVFNYLQYSNFKEAKKSPLNALIPSKFTFFDKNKKSNIVEIGNAEDVNEFLQAGVSATQDVKTYLFNIQNGKTIRVIDTPGMGDTRGIDQDNYNCESILDYISKLSELHAICFLFKSKHSRITVYFKYCLSQIFSRLDKSAKDNLTFVFTNTRGDNYSPGETYTILEQILKDIKESPPFVEIPLNKNIFCFDNEGFRFIAAVQKNIMYDDYMKKTSIESWTKSREECWRMIEYIDNLKPHHVHNTACVNEARRMIVHLSQPMAEIAQLINDNLYALDKHQGHLNLDNQSLEELKAKLYVPVINLKEIKMSQPATVCTSMKCAEFYKVTEDLSKWHYKQRCHDPCYLTNVPEKIVGAPELARCTAMNHSSGMCNKCSCNFSMHQHIYYMAETFEDRVLDKSMNKNITSKEQVMQNARDLIKGIEVRQRELETELHTIIKCNAMFAHFLQNNAIAPFSDSYEEYIEYLLVRERSMGHRANRTVIRQLQNIKLRYAEMKKVYDEALKLSEKIGHSAEIVTPKSIQDSIQELYKLKHMGQKIKNLYELQKTAQKKEHQYTEHTENVKSSFSSPTNQNDGKMKDDKKRTQNDNTRGNYHNQNKNYQRNQNQRPRGRSPPPTYSTVYQQGYPNYPPQPAPTPYGPAYGYRPPHGYREPRNDDAHPRQDTNRNPRKENIQVTINLPQTEASTPKDHYDDERGPSLDSPNQGMPYPHPGPLGYYPPPGPSGYYPPPGPSGYYPPPMHYPPYDPNMYHPNGPSYHGPPPAPRGGYRGGHHYPAGHHYPQQPHSNHSNNNQQGTRDNQRGVGQYQRGMGAQRRGRTFKNRSYSKGRRNSTKDNDSDSDTSVASSRSYKRY